MEAVDDASNYGILEVASLRRWLAAESSGRRAARRRAQCLDHRRDRRRQPQSRVRRRGASERARRPTAY